MARGVPIEGLKLTDVDLKYEDDGVTYFRGEPVWQTEDFRHYYLSDMTSDHIRNCVARIFLRSSSKGWRKAYLPLLAEELKKRDD